MTGIRIDQWRWVRAVHGGDRTEMRGPAPAVPELYRETEASREARLKVYSRHSRRAAGDRMSWLPDAR